MHKSSLIALILGIALLSGCSQDTPATSNNVSTSEEIQSTQGMSTSKIEAGRYPEGSVSQPTMNNDNVTTSFEDDLKKQITEIIKVDIGSLSVRAELQKEYERRKYNASINGNKNYGLSPSIEKELNIGNIHIYTINPFSKDYTNDDCLGYMYSTCLNFIVDTETKKVLFTDIDTESSGEFNSFDSQKKIAYFSEAHGEGNMCFSGFVTTYRAVVLGSKDLVTKTIENTSRCNNENCDCSNQEDDWIEKESITYTQGGKKVPETTDIQEIFSFIKE